MVIFELPSRDHRGAANITVSIEGLKNRFDFREAVDYVVTEYGVASLKGLTLRERAQALIEIAHPVDRVELIVDAKRENILYRDQIYLAESARYFPSHINERHQFSNTAMTKVFSKSGLPVLMDMENGVYHVTIPFDPPSSGDAIGKHPHRHRQ